MREKHTSKVTTGEAGNRHSLRDGFSGFLRALPGDRAFCHRRLRGCEGILADLMSASRHQDHTTSPAASLAFVLRKKKSVHRIPHSTFVTIAKRPSCSRRDARKMRLILAACEANYFLRKGWTGFSKICPTGKSVGAKKSDRSASNLF
jgi:hypothetical protein